MKLALAPLAVVLAAAAMLTGCGPGMSHRAQAPVDVLQAMNDELLHAPPGGSLDVVGTTTLTSAPAQLETPLPESRMPMSRPNDAEPATQTWGGTPQQDPGYSEEYGF